MGDVCVLVLGAGYGTRLQKGIEEDAKGDFKFLLGKPKALLHVGGKPLLSHWFDALRTNRNVKQFYVVTNGFFAEQFEEWGKQQNCAFPASNIINDHTMNNETRLGAIADINLVLQTKKEEIGESGIVIIAGDTLFHKDFDIEDFTYQFSSRTVDACGVVYYEVDDTEVRKRGIIEFTEDHRVTSFLEKPDPASTTSRNACPAFYYIPASGVPLVDKFMEEHKNEPLDARDAPGRLIAWLHHHLPVYAYKISVRNWTTLSYRS
eukprot:CFRG0201T1